jgi:hypothetical protein
MDNEQTLSNGILLAASLKKAVARMNNVHLGFIG